MSIIMIISSVARIVSLHSLEDTGINKILQPLPRWCMFLHLNMDLDYFHTNLASRSKWCHPSQAHSHMSMEWCNYHDHIQDMVRIQYSSLLTSQPYNDIHLVAYTIHGSDHIPMSIKLYMKRDPRIKNIKIHSIKDLSMWRAQRNSHELSRSIRTLLYMWLMGRQTMLSNSDTLLGVMNYHSQRD